MFISSCARECARVSAWLVFAFAAQFPLPALAELSPFPALSSSGSGSNEQPYDVAKKQLAAGEYDAAIQLADQRLAELQQQVTRFDPSLADPLALRAEALFQLEHYDAAIHSFLQAQHIVRMNDGLHTIKQLPMLYRLAEAHNALGDPVSANNYEEAALARVNRAYPADAVERIPALMRLADWYLQAGYTTASRGLYKQAATITQQRLPQTNEDYVRSLKGLAATYIGQAFPNFDRAADAYYSQFKPSSMPTPAPRYGMTPVIDVGQAVAFNDFRGGERALSGLVSFHREQLDEARAQSSALSVIEQLEHRLARSLVELGDWHVRLRESRKALAAFSEAQALLPEEQALQEFSGPKLLFMPKLGAPDSKLGVTQTNEQNGDQEALATNPEPTNLKPTNLKDGEVRFTLHIDKNGLVRRIEKIRSIPEDLIVFRYKQQTRRARYRPAFVDGQFDRHAEVEAVHRFTFVQQPDLRANESTANFASVAQN